MKLTDYGAATSEHILDREDERVAALARRAQNGDYNEGLWIIGYLLIAKCTDLF